jgi:predicted metal-dependent HD superfamily phosphohydrolase
VNGRGTPSTPARRRLRVRGIADLVALGAAPGDAAAAIDGLLARYDESHRRYHTTEHLAEALDRADELARLADSPLHVRLALWWHDAVYGPAPGDDERASAELAERQLGGLGVGGGVTAEVGRLVRLTAGHQLADPDDHDGAVLLDADLAVLAAAPARYERYVDGVRHEYRAVADAAWRRGRARVLRSFLARPRVFTTGGLGSDAERRARANLSRKLATLVGPDGSTEAASRRRTGP